MIKLSKYNSKIGNILNINLPPGVSCKGCIDLCYSKCYARRYYRQYPGVKKAYDDNYIMATDFEELYFLSIRDSLAKYKGEYFRWHCSGDIISRSYFNGMVAIAAKFPKIKFLTFTKQYDIVNKYLDRYCAFPDNFTVLFSTWPNHTMDNPKHLPIAYMRDKAGIEDRIPEGIFECPGSCIGCKHCWDSNASVVFNQH